MRLLPVLFLAFCCFACGGDPAPAEPSATTKSEASEVVESKDLITGLLDVYPAELIESGCGCSLNLEDGKADELLFVFDWKGNGAGTMRINGKDVVLQRGASLKTSNQKYDSYLHQNDRWTVKTSITDRGPAENDGTTYTGKVKISNRRTGVKKELRVKGVCSC